MHIYLIKNNRVDLKCLNGIKKGQQPMMLTSGCPAQFAILGRPHSWKCLVLEVDSICGSSFQAEGSSGPPQTWIVNAFQDRRSDLLALIYGVVSVGELQTSQQHPSVQCIPMLILQHNILYKVCSTHSYICTILP